MTLEDWNTLKMGDEIRFGEGPPKKISGYFIEPGKAVSLYEGWTKVEPSPEQLKLDRIRAYLEENNGGIFGHMLEQINVIIDE